MEILSWFLQKGEADTYTNGRARFEIRGSLLIAHPGDGSGPWQTRLDAGTPSALGQALALLLKTPDFQSDAQIIRLNTRREQAAESLRYLGTEIAEAPESPVAVQLRRLLWTMYNRHHLVGLWQLRYHLNPRQQAAVSVLVVALMEGHISEDALRQGLIESGETDRWDHVHLAAPQHERLVEALDSVTAILNSLPPGRPTSELARAYALMQQVADCLRAEGGHRVVTP